MREWGMANRTAAALLLRVGDQAKLEQLTRASTTPAGVAARAGVVLLAATGVANYEIAQRLGMSGPTVKRWRQRYAEQGLAGLADVARPGRPRSVDRSKI